MTQKIKVICCAECGNDASFFHSKCCGAHFEGIVDNGKPIIVCDKCGKYVGHVSTKKKNINDVYEI